MLKEFRDFAARGNVIDLAVGVIIGAAFGKVVTSVVNDLIMPPIGMALGRIDFSNLFVALNGVTYASLAEAKAATPPAPTLNYRPLPEHLPRVPDRRVRRFPARQAGQPAQGSAPRRRRRPGLPVLPDEDSAQGDAVRRLHLGNQTGCRVVRDRSIDMNRSGIARILFVAAFSVARRRCAGAEAGSVEVPDATARP